MSFFCYDSAGEDLWTRRSISSPYEAEHLCESNWRSEWWVSPEGSCSHAQVCTGKMTALVVLAGAEQHGTCVCERERKRKFVCHPLARTLNWIRLLSNRNSPFHLKKKKKRIPPPPPHPPFCFLRNALILCASSKAVTSVWPLTPQDKPSITDDLWFMLLSLQARAVRLRAKSKSQLDPVLVVSK